ncbi:MAG: 4Fe-4S binding protein [Oscillospiraceae bacterium]
MSKVKLNISRCKGCGYCVEECPKKAISFSSEISAKGYNTIQVDEALCIGCGSCYRVCPDCVFEILE